MRNDLEQALFGERDPIKVDIADLDALVAEDPKGRVDVGLDWARLVDDEAFERLVFLLIDMTAGYENPEWLTKVNAPDRSRDLSAIRVIQDQISGTTRQRIIIQCKHWQAKSVSVSDAAAAVAAMALWEPPPVDVLAIAISGRFTSDAVAWIEKHNHAGKMPRIEMWPDSHLELALARHPALTASFGLYQG